MNKTIEYERMIDEEEQSLVHKAEIEMMKIKIGKTKTYSFQEIKESISSQNEF